MSAPAVPSSYDNNWRIMAASSSSISSRMRERCSPGISAKRSARSSYSISSSTFMRRSRSRPSMSRNCSASGSSSNKSARRSSSIASASCRRCVRGSARTKPATSLGCMSRKRAASAAISVVGANSVGTASQSTKRYVGRRRNALRRARRTLLTSQPGVRPSSRNRKATSLTTSSPTFWLMTPILRRRSPSLGLKGWKSTSQLFSRAPALSREATRLAFTKMRRRWLLATKPNTCGAEEVRPETTTTSSRRPIGAPPASRRDRRITRNA